jgi:AcrR family transcriptional regulator
LRFGSGQNIFRLMNYRVNIASKRPRLSPDERILKCALTEFAQHGYVGARMDRIARQAKISKRMLFYYFGSKERLFEVVVESAWKRGEASLSSAATRDELSFSWSSFQIENPEFTRLLGWEGLEWYKGAIPRRKERRTFWKRQVEIIKKSILSEHSHSGVDASYVLLCFVVMEMAPVLLPNLVYLVMDRDAADPEFQREWISFLCSVKRALLHMEHSPNAPFGSRVRNGRSG